MSLVDAPVPTIAPPSYALARYVWLGPIISHALICINLSQKAFRIIVLHGLNLLSASKGSKLKVSFHFFDIWGHYTQFKTETRKGSPASSFR